MSPRKSAKVFSDEELAAARETARERRVEARRGPAQQRELGERDLLAKIAAMPTADRVMGERLHAIVTKNAPELMPKTWYGMPAWATSEGKIICFFKAADKFKSRYATLGFEETARIDDGPMWATSWALLKLTPEDEKTIAALVRKAVS